MAKSVKRDVIRNMEMILSGRVKGMPKIDAEANLGAEEIDQAVEYMSLNSGKMVRSLLSWGVAQAYNVDRESSMFYAAVGEAIQAGSVHLDDLPCMDDATLRRYLPPCHIKFSNGASEKGIAVTILASHDMVDYFELAAMHYEKVPREKREEILDAIKLRKKEMVRGQYLDLYGREEFKTIDDFARMNKLKTGALFALFTELPTIIAGASEIDRYHIREFGYDSGTGFQFLDDIKDKYGSKKKAGKDVRKERNKKSPFDVAECDNAVFEEYLKYKNRAVDHLTSLGKNFRSLKRSMTIMENQMTPKRFNRR
jgi:geranylgeranyl diphosphate synthase, type II